MTPQEERKLVEVVNSHASDIQALTSMVYGLLAQLHESQGETGIAAAEARTMATAKNMGSPFSVRPNTGLISKLFQAARQPS